MQKIIISLFLLLNLLFSCKANEEKNTEYSFLSSTELALKSKGELRLLRNEVYARKGYVFKSDDLQDYFFKQAWYQPEMSNDLIELSTAEKDYVDVIKELEQR